MQKQTNSFETAIHEKRERLFNYILKRVSNRADAEDLLQDVMYQLLAGYSIAEPIENLTAWLYTVARNRIIDWYRKRRPQPVTDLTNEEGGPLDLADLLYDPSYEPDTLYQRSIVWTALADALDELPSERRQVFVQHELEGKSFKQIAEITGEPLNTLLSRKRYAVLYLRERLNELYRDFDNV
ncbi:MAG: RNA polymerase sigma factor [Bacteroidota bacterium]